MGAQNPFRPLGHRNFRLLWTGEVLRTSAHWMDLLTRGLLVLELTGSAADVALTTAARALPLFFVGIWGGLLADRVDRRRLLLASRSITVIAYVSLAVLVFFGWTQMWEVYVTAVIVGLGQALNGPARQSLLPSLVPTHELRSAVVLNTATLNIGQAIGPIIAGWSVSLAGIAFTFLLQAAFILLGGFLISRMDVAGGAPGVREPLRRSVADGVRYLMTRPLLLGLFFLGVNAVILVEPFRGVVPVIAVEQLGAGSALTGLLMGSLGVGAVLAVMTLAVFPTALASWRLIMVGATGFAISIACFAISHSAVVSSILLFAAGFSQACFRTQSQSLQLAETEDRFRGRISSLWVVIRGTEPIGSVLLAGLTVALGVGAALGGMTAAALVTIVVVAVVTVRAWR